MTPKDRPRIDLSDIRKILLLRPRRLGDIILTTPAVRALRQSFPAASITYLVETPYRRLVDGRELVDEVVALPPRSSPAYLIRIILKLRRRGYDLLVDFHGGPRSAVIAFFSGARLRVGYKTKYKAWIYHRRVSRSRPEGPIHSVANHLNLVRAVGLEITDDFPLYVPGSTAEERDKAEAFWQGWSLGSSRVLAVHISAGNRFRDWGQENLVRFLNKILLIPGITPLLVGSEEDIAREKQILTSLQRPVPSVVGKVSLGELIAFLERVDAFVGPDSGPMHLAAALKRPVVALFGPTLPAHFAPWKTQTIILERPLPCRPCRQRSCPETDYPCIREISPDEAVAATLSLLRACSKA